MGFADSLKKNISNSIQHVNDVIMQDDIKLFGQSLVDYSPKKPDARFAKGVFINAWYPAVNEFDPTVGVVQNMEGEDSLQRLKAILTSNAFVGKDAFISFSNNVDHAQLVENLGWRNTGPYAPVRNSITYVMGANKL